MDNICPFLVRWLTLKNFFNKKRPQRSKILGSQWVIKELGKGNFMIKLYLFFNLFLSLFVASCSKQVIKHQVDGNVIQKELIKYVSITWKLNTKYITNLPPNIKEKIIKSCNSTKFTLVKISTIDFEKTKGTFRCN